jgi:hypothetical protein
MTGDERNLRPKRLIGVDADFYAEWRRWNAAKTW